MTVKDCSLRIPGGRVGVLLLHGLCGSPTELRFVANGLARAGYTVHCPQLAGHGGTEEDLKATVWQDWYRSAEKALEDLSIECDTVIVGGLSTGAVLSLLLAANHPSKVRALALYTPTLWLNGFQIPWYMHLFRLVPIKSIANCVRFPTPHQFGIKDPRIRQFVSKALKSEGWSGAPVSTPGGTLLERRRLMKAAKRALPRIGQPALIIHPREDEYAALDNASYLQSNLAGDVDLVVLDDSYHMVTIDRQRHVVLERTAAFVEHIAQSLENGLGRAKAALPSPLGRRNETLQPAVG
jgi:carboxylesterase